MSINLALWGSHMESTGFTKLSLIFSIHVSHLPLSRQTTMETSAQCVLSYENILMAETKS